MTDEKADRSAVEVEILTEPATIRANQGHMAADVAAIKKANANLSERFVTRREFEPLRRAYYSAIGLVVGGLILAFLNFVIANPLVP